MSTYRSPEPWPDHLLSNQRIDVIDCDTGGPLALRKAYEIVRSLRFDGNRVLRCDCNSTDATMLNWKITVLYEVPE